MYFFILAVHLHYILQGQTEGGSSVFRVSNQYRITAVLKVEKDSITSIETSPNFFSAYHYLIL